MDGEEWSKVRLGRWKIGRQDVGVGNSGIKYGNKRYIYALSVPVYKKLSFQIRPARKFSANFLSLSSGVRVSPARLHHNRADILENQTLLLVLPGGLLVRLFKEFLARSVLLIGEKLLLIHSLSSPSMQNFRPSLLTRINLSRSCWRPFSVVLCTHPPFLALLVSWL